MGLRPVNSETEMYSGTDVIASVSKLGLVQLCVYRV